MTEKTPFFAPLFRTYPMAHTVLALNAGLWFLILRGPDVEFGRNFGMGSALFSLFLSCFTGFALGLLLVLVYMTGVDVARRLQRLPPFDWASSGNGPSLGSAIDDKGYLHFWGHAIFGALAGIPYVLWLLFEGARHAYREATRR